MKKCLTCQNAIESEYLYCPKCGTEVIDKKPDFKNSLSVIFSNERNIFTEPTNNPQVKKIMWISALVFTISLWLHASYYKEQYFRGSFQSEDSVISALLPLILVTLFQFVFITSSIKTNTNKAWWIPFVVTLFHTFVFYNMYRELNALQMDYGMTGDSLIVDAMIIPTVSYAGLCCLFLLIPTIISLNKED